MGLVKNGWRKRMVELPRARDIGNFNEIVLVKIQAECKNSSSGWMFSLLENRVFWNIS